MENEKKIFKAAVVNADKLVEEQARDVGDAKMTESREDRSKSRVSKFFSRIWKHNIAQDYYRQKEIFKAKKDILDSGDLYVGETEFTDQEASNSHHQNAMKAIVDRFVSEYEEDVLSESERASKEEASAPLNNEIKSLIQEYAGGDMPEEAFQEEKKRILTRYNPEYAQDRSLYADNLLEIAKEVRESVEHGEALDRLDFDVNISLGEARQSLKTESKKTTLDKLLGNSGAGKSIAKSAIMVGAVSGAYSVTKSLTLGLGRKTAKWLGFGAGIAAAGAVAGFKENSRIKRERSQHIRESAKGMKFTEDDMERREEMEENRYETISATETIRSLEADLARVNEGNVSAEDAQAILARVAEVESRIRLGDQNGIDLVSYDHFGKVEQDRTSMDLRRAELKVALRRSLEGQSFDFMNNRNMDEYLLQLTGALSRQFTEGEIAQKDRIFKEMKRKKVGKKVAQAMLFGTAFSFAADEMGSWFDSSKDGVIEGTVKSVRDHFSDDPQANSLEQTATSIEAVRRWVFNDAPRMPADSMHEIAIGDTQVHMPEGVEMVKNPDGSFDILRNDEVIADDVPLRFDADGNLTQESRDLLAKDDIYADFCKEIGGSSETITVPAEEYANNHPELTHRIHREVWFGNDTPMYPDPDNPGHLLGADLNELRTHWAGLNGTGIDADGNYVFNVQHMTDDGSFQDGLSIEAHKMMEKGELKMLFSLTKESQFNVFEVPIDANGNAIIDPNSPIGQMMFETDANGHAVFTGQFAEVAHSTGIAEDGGENVQILGTHIGTGRPGEVIENIVKDTPHVTIDVPGDNDYEPPIPIPPATPRRPLERGKYEAGQADIPFAPEDPDRPFYGYNEKLKTNYSNLNEFRNDNSQLRELEERVKNTPELKEKYSSVLAQLEKYRYQLDRVKNSRPLQAKEEAMLNRKLNSYNKRFRPDNPINMETYLSGEILRINRQIENIIIEESSIGYKPFDNSFYERSPIINGIKNAQEVVIILDDPVGDAVLSVPVIESLNRYLTQNGENKKIRVIAKQKNLLSSLENQYGGNIELYDTNEAKAYFEGNQGVERYIINANKILDDYSMFDISPDDAKNTSKVMSVDWASWTKEEYPREPGKLTKYDMMPARIARNFELILGQKLYEDINTTDHFIDRGPNFEVESNEIKTRLNIKDDEKIFTISAGSSVTPKEYQPEKWEKVIEGLVSKYPNAHVVFLDDPNPDKREVYGKMVDALAGRGINISRTSEGMDKMNTLMSMSDYVLTPDTGLGHYAGALGKPTVMLFLSDPVLWSTPGAIRMMHPKAYETYRKGRGSYDRAWDKGARDSYFVEDGGVLVGMSDLEPDRILNKIERTENKETPEIPKPPVERKETVSKSDLSVGVKDMFAKILKDNGDNATIEKFDLDIVGNSIVGHAELKAKNSAGGTPKIDLDLVSGGPAGLMFNSTGNNIKANMLARGAVNEAVMGVPRKVVQYLETSYGGGKKLKNLGIKDGQIEMTF